MDFRERSTRGSRALHARVVATFDNAFLQSVCMRTDAWLVDQTRGKHRKPTVLANDCDHSTPMIIKTVIKHSNIMPTDNSHHSLLPNFVCPHSLSLTGVYLNPYPGLSHDFLASGWVGISLSQSLITVSRQNNVFLTEKACEHAVQGTGNTKPARRPSRLKTKLIPHLRSTFILELILHTTVLQPGPYIMQRLAILNVCYNPIKNVCKGVNA